MDNLPRRYYEERHIIYDVRRIGDFGVQAKSVIDDEYHLFNGEHVEYLPNWTHRVDGKLKKVYVGTKFRLLEEELMKDE